MKQKYSKSLLLLLLGFTMCLTGCGNDAPAPSNSGTANSSSAPSSPEPSAPIIPIQLQDLNGKLVTITPDANTSIFGVATWCPYTASFLTMLNDARLKPYLQNKKLIFVFDQSEWDTVNKSLDDDMKTAQGNDLAQLTEAKTKYAQLQTTVGGSFVKPSMLDQCPGTLYQLPANSSVSIKSFPSLYASTNGVFDKGYVDFLLSLVDNDNAPLDLITNIINDHQIHEN